jgi:hypothetical protein
LYANWAKAGGIAAIFILILLFFNSKATVGSIEWLFWLQLPLYMLHQVEENVFPGGFIKCLNETVYPSGAKSGFPANEKDCFWINIMYIWVLYTVAAIFGLRWVILPGIAVAFTGINGILHVGVLIKKRSYDPGAVVSVFFNIPFAFYVFQRLLHEKLMNPGQFAVSLVSAIFLHALLPAYFLYKAKRKAA